MSSQVDILMATYNGERFLAEQIESIRYQTHEDWRLLISDDCSTDGTLAIADRYAALDSRIEIVSRGVRYGSAKANFLSLLEKSNADYVMFCDQDDIWFDDKIDRSIAVMRELEAEAGADVPLVVFGDMIVVDEGLNVISESFERYSYIDSSRTEFRQVLAQAVGAGCTMMVNSMLVNDLRASAGQIDSMVMHDWWACLVAAAFGGLVRIPATLCLYRQHDANSVGAARFRVLRGLDEIVQSTHQSIRQAEAFYSLFDSALSGRGRLAARRYASIGYAGPIGALAYQLGSGAWKYGFRKIGQVVGVICVGAGNVNAERSYE